MSADPSGSSHRTRLDAGEEMDTSHLLPPGAAIKEHGNTRGIQGDCSSPAAHLTRPVHLRRPAGAASQLSAGKLNAFAGWICYHGLLLLF